MNIDNNRANDFENAFNKLMENEGSFSNDKHDLGRATIYGITSRDYPHYYTIIKQLFDEGNKALALKTASNFYRKEFWNELYKEIPDSSLAFKLFDLSVNRGKKTAVKLLQQTLFFDFGQNLTIDGVFGKGTLTSIKLVVNQDALYQKYIERNEASYKKLSTFYRFGKGWLNRLRRKVYV